MKSKIEAMYLDYYNNFLTISFYASYYGIDEKLAERILKIGRRLNHRRSKNV